MQDTNLSPMSLEESLSLKGEETLEEEGREEALTSFKEKEEATIPLEGEKPQYWRTAGGMVKATKEMPERVPNDYYPTPPLLARAAVGLFPHMYSSGVTFLDPGCGSGIWGVATRERWQKSSITGIDVEDRGLPEGVYDEFVVSDFLNYHPGKKFTHIAGNPPYSLMEEFVRKGESLLANDGRMIFLGPLEFLAGQKRGLGLKNGKSVGNGLWYELPPREVYILPQRPSFTGDNKTNAREYALYSWVKGWAGGTSLEWLRWR